VSSIDPEFGEDQLREPGDSADGGPAQAQPVLIAAPRTPSSPYCWADSHTSDTWLEYQPWRHARNTKQVGIPTPLGCIGLGTIHAHLRYAANGFWDYQY
jgi:hypothetical protein